MNFHTTASASPYAVPSLDGGRARLAKRAELFWAKVDRRGPDECWPWKGARSPKGYGRFCVKEGDSPRGKVFVATRVSWSLTHSVPWPAGKIACHSCDNPPCVNPAHIWPGTNAQNQKDMALKGRHHSHNITHCKRGHAYAEQRLFPSDISGGRRRCRECYDEMERLRRDKRKALVANSNDAGLPLWARPHARLIAEIVAEQPERTKVLTEFSANSPASFGYRGKKAALLRVHFDRIFSDMMRHLPEHGSLAYEAARDGLIRFEREQGPDAVIAKAMAS